MSKSIIHICAAMLCAVMISATGSAVHAQMTVPEIVATGCKKEINTYCKKVTPGQSRVLSCLYAYNDKISDKCLFAIADGWAEFERAMAAVNYLAKQTMCRSHIATYCRDVPPGGGRIYNCLWKNRATLSDECLKVMPKAKELLIRAGVMAK